MRPFKVLIIFFLLLLPAGLKAQFGKERMNWCFGDKVGIDFNVKPPAVSLGQRQMMADFGTAVVSDEQGKLLFYTRGDSVWNRYDQCMSNGFGLGGNINSAQMVIAPLPKSSRFYYVFTPANSGLVYSVVDMSADSNKGAVVLKNQPVGPLAIHKLAVVQHENGEDFWVVGFEPSLKYFRAYLFSSSGIDTSVYVRSAVGGAPRKTNDYLGSIVFSFDARHMAACFRASSQVCLYDFNAATGALSYKYSLAVNAAQGAAFSPSGQFLYAGSAFGGSKPNLVRQFNVSSNDSAWVQNNYLEINRGPSAAPFHMMQQGPDGKLYINRFYSTYLSAVPFPDLPWPACGLEDTALSFANVSGLNAKLSMPSFAVRLNPSIKVSDTCAGDSTMFLAFPFGADSVFWDFGDSSSGAANFSQQEICRHIYSDTGAFTLRLIRWKSPRVDTLLRTVHIIRAPVFNLGSDTTICSGDSLLLSTGLDSTYTFSWSNGSSLPAQRLSTPGIFHVSVHKAGCSSTDTVVLSLRSRPVFSLGADTIICDGDSIKLDPGLGAAYNYQWSSSDTNQYQWVSKKGLYWLQVSDSFCNSTDSMNLDLQPTPLIRLPADTFLCAGDSLRLQLLSPGSYTYQWSTGAVTPATPVQTSAVYRVRVEQGKCRAADSSKVNIYPAATALELGIDTHLCHGAAIQLSAVAGQPAIYTWQDGSTDSVLQVSLPGVYFVKRQTTCITEADSITIDPCPCKLRVPNVFTPDADGFNDVFRADSCEPRSFNMLIYNRWGQLLFESQDIRQGWDGRSKSGDAPEGTYYWQVRYTLSSGQEIRLIGNLLLIR